MPKTKKGKQGSRTKPKANKISVKLLQNLAIALENIAASPRFFVLGGIQVSRLLGDKEPAEQTGSSLTITEMVRRGAESVCGEGIFQEQDLRKIIAQLNTFAAGDCTAEPEPINGSANAVELTVIAAQALDAPPRFSSTEVENRLIAAFSRLLNSPVFETVRRRRLEEFWGESAASDPFLQCLTFQQLSTMDVSSLMKKRSFTEQKALALVGAIYSALGDEAGLSALSTQTPAKRQVFIEKSYILEPEVRWKPGALSIPPYLDGFLRFYESQISQFSGEPSPLAALLKQLPNVILADDFALAMIAYEQNSESAAKIVGCDLIHADRAIERVSDALRQLLEITAPLSHAHWNSTLNTPGIREDELLSPYLIKGSDVTMQRLVMRLCLKALGGKHPNVDGVLLRNYWCRQERALHMILHGIKSSLPLSDEKLRDDMRQLLPSFDEESLLDCIKSWAEFNAEENLWVARRLGHPS